MLVELFGVDADHRRIARLGVLHLLLLLQCGLDDARIDDLLSDENFADRMVFVAGRLLAFLRLQRFVQFMPGERAAVDEDLAELHLLVAHALD